MGSCMRHGMHLLAVAMPLWLERVLGCAGGGPPGPEQTSDRDRGGRSTQLARAEFTRLTIPSFCWLTMHNQTAMTKRTTSIRVDDRIFMVESSLGQKARTQFRGLRQKALLLQVVWCLQCLITVRCPLPLSACNTLAALLRLLSPDPGGDRCV